MSVISSVTRADACVWLLRVNGVVVQNYLDLTAAQLAGLNVGRRYVRKHNFSHGALRWETSTRRTMSRLVLRRGSWVSLRLAISVWRYPV